MIVWAGQAISRIGSRASALALPLLVLALTRSAADAGFIGAIGSFPSLLICIPAGAYLDRWDRKRAMILCDSGRALVFGTVVIAIWANRLTMWHLSIAAACEGILAAFFDIAQMSCIPQLVPREQLPSAVAQNEALFPLGDLIGPWLGGLLFSFAGHAAPFLVDALSYMISIAALCSVKFPPQQSPTTGNSRLRREIVTGLRWIWHSDVIRLLAILSAGSFFIDAGSPIILIVLAKAHGASAQEVGGLFTLASLGGFVGFFSIGPLQRRCRLGHILIGTIALQTCVWALLACSPPILVVGILAASSYCFLSVYNSVEGAYRLATIPDGLAGRVNSAFHVIALSCYPLGNAATGVMIQWTGMQTTLILFFVWVLALSMFAVVLRPLRCAQFPIESRW